MVYGKGDWLIDYDATQLYLNRALIEDKGLSLSEFQNKVADFMIEFEGVAKTLTANALTHGTFSQGKEALVQNNFSRKKSGDVIYYLLPGWSNELKSKEDFYFRHSKRNVVPLYFAGAGIRKGNPKKCKITDIVPILRNVMGMNEL
ncbi:hypothetical protein FACS1894195_5410 [Bacteroidia bacterium]|nr:hypothetical protein FACS1894195_5410 [Bacteroidia bacterium]